MAHRTHNHRPSSSARSLPPIAEDEITQSPSPPLRIPPKSPRRGLPPPYVPTLHPPPSYKEVGGRIGGGDEKRDAYALGGGWDRRRWCAVLGVATVVLVVVMVIGLGVGLGVGLKKSHHSSSSSDDRVSAPAPSFPAGSFTFNTTLQNVSTACTSNAATWRCYPYAIAQPAVFFWIISTSNSGYSISSTDNPFAPSFANLTLDAVAQGQYVFSFGMNRTVVPGSALTSDNSAATCVFLDTTFRGTLWTSKLGAEETVDDEGDGGTFAAWPGDVQVEQYVTGGSVECTDAEGNTIASVTAEDGECQCGYASYQEALQ